MALGEKYEIMHCTIQINDKSDQAEHHFEKENATNKSVEDFPIATSPIRFNPDEQDFWDFNR